MRNLSYFGVILFLLFFISCEKAPKFDTDIQTASDLVLAEAAFSQIFPTIHFIGKVEEGIYKGSDDFTCANYTITGSFDSSVVTVVIDYGEVGCNDIDGKFKKGKVIALFSNRWSLTGSTVDVSFETFEVDGKKLSGSIQCKNNGMNSFSITIMDGRIYNEDWSVSYNAIHSILQFEGFETDTIASDDAYSKTGTSTGINSNGISFSSEIISPIIKRNDCKWIESGIFEVKPEGLSARTLNFGDGTCDNDAIIIIEGNIFNIKL
jgi:hypothetical protein